MAEARSPPSRGAWIEMGIRTTPGAWSTGRPPRGGRGLKWGLKTYVRVIELVAPLAGGVD